MPKEKIITLIELLFIGTGFIFMIIAKFFFRKPGVPLFSINPKYWMPVWKLKQFIRSPGFELSLIGTIMAVAGVVFSLLR